MDKLTLGMQIKQQYPGSYDDLPDDQLGAMAVAKYARDAQVDPEDEFETPGKVWEWLTNPIAPELDREKFMPHDESGPAGKLQEFIGEAAYQFYRGMVRPATSPLGAAMGAGLAAPGLVRKATLGAMGVMGLTGAAAGLEQLASADNHGDRINAAVDTALSGLMGVGGLAGAAALPRNVIEAPISKIPRVFRNWRQWARATPEQQAALGGESKKVLEWKQLELPLKFEEENQAPREVRKLSDPWYTFKSLKGLGNTLFKPDKKGKIPPGVPAANFMDALNNPQIIPAGDAFWLGLRQMGERKMRSGDKVSWVDIMNTVDDNLTLSQIYRVKDASSTNTLKRLSQQFVEEHPDVRRMQHEISLADAQYASDMKYVDNFSGFVHDKISRQLEILYRKRETDPAVKALFTDEYGYENTVRGAFSRVSDILYVSPDLFYEAFDPTAANTGGSWSRHSRAHMKQMMDSIDKTMPGVGGLIRVYMMQAYRAGEAYKRFGRLGDDLSTLQEQLQARYAEGRRPTASGGEVSPDLPIYQNYGIQDGEGYETNVVVAKRRSFDLIDERMQDLAVRIDQLDDTLRRGRAGEAEPMNTAVPWLEAERDRLNEEYAHLHEAKMFANYDRGHIREKGSLGHYRWDGRTTYDAQGGNEGWTAFAKEIQSDWNEAVRRNGMKGAFKAKEFEKIWGVMQKVKALADQNFVLKNGSFGKYMNEIDAAEPVFPQFRNLPAQVEFAEGMREPFQGQKLLIDGEPVSLHTLTPAQRNTLIQKNDAEIAKLHESVRREMNRYYGGDLVFKREPIYDYDHYDYNTGTYRLLGYNEGWVQQGYPADYRQAVGPFVDDANKINELLLKAFIRRALTKGHAAGRQYEYIGLIGGKLSAQSQGYGTPYRYVDVAPATSASLSSIPGQQPLLGTYNVRGFDKGTGYHGDIYYNQTINDISNLFGPEIANRIASESWGRLTGGTPMLRNASSADLELVNRIQEEVHRVRKTDVARKKLIKERLQGAGIVERNGEYFAIPEESWELMISNRYDPPGRRRAFEQLESRLPQRFELPLPAVLPQQGSNPSTYKGQINAYDGMTRGILSRIAKEFGTEVEEGRVWATSGYGVEPAPGHPEYWFRDWHYIWRMKVTPKMLETVLYGLTGITP